MRIGLTCPRSTQDADEACAAAELRMGEEEVALSAQAGRMGEVVGVHAGDEFARGLAPGEVGGLDEAAFVAEEPDPGIGGRETREDLGRAVAGGMVDDDDLEIAQVLRKQARKGGAHRSGGVANGHGDGDGGHGRKEKGPGSHRGPWEERGRAGFEPT